MHRGWVKHYRKELDSEIFQMPPLYSKIWQWLKLSVDHTTGSIRTTPRQLAREVQWTERGAPRVPNHHTIMVVIEWMELRGMVSSRRFGVGNAVYTEITICNWSLYQSCVQSEVTQDRRSQATARHTVQELEILKNEDSPLPPTGGSQTFQKAEVEYLKDPEPDFHRDPSFNPHAIYDLWTSLSLPLPRSGRYSDRLAQESLIDNLHRLHPHWTPTDVDKAIRKIATTPALSWARNHGPGYLAQTTKAGTQVIEVVLGWTNANGKPQKQSIEEILAERKAAREAKRAQAQ